MAIDNKDKKILNVPHLRFPEFTDEWKESVLSDFVERVKRKNKNNLCKLPLTISAQYGLVDQISFFNKVIASENMSNYYLLHKGDFAYNKSYSSEYPWGAIKRLDCYEQGTLSSLYICFKPYSHVSSDFLTHYFETSKWHQGISEIAVEGARNHGLLNVGIQDFFETRHCLPQSLLEQEKIAKFLNLIEERIATQNKIIEKLQSLIKGLIDDIITLKCGQLVAFETLYSKAGEGGTPTTSNTEFYDNGSIPFIKIDDLSNKYLSANKDYITELGLKKSSAWLIPTHSIIYSNGATIGAISINKYPVCTKQGILGIVPNTNIDVEFLYYFMQSSYFQKEVERVVTEGTMKTAYLKDINHIKCPIPDLDRQKEISHLLSVLSLKEDVERQLLQKYQIQKQYLLRKMFI